MSFLKDSLGTLIIRSLSIAVSVVTGVINARFLGPELLGVLVLISLVPSASFRFANFGFGSAFSYFLAKKKIQLLETIKLSSILVITLSSVSITCFYAVSQLSGNPWDDAPLFGVVIGGCLIPLIFFQNFYQRILMGRLRISSVNRSELLGTVVNGVLIVSLVAVLGMSLQGALFALIASRLVVVLALVCELHILYGERAEDVAMEGTPIGVKEMYKYGWWNYLIMLNRFLLEMMPIVFLKTFNSNLEVGYLSAAKTITGKVQVLPDTFSSLLFPYTSGSSSLDGKLRTNKLTRFFVVFMVLMVAFLFVVGAKLILFLFGPSYTESALALKFLLPVLIFYPLYKIQNVHLAGSGSARSALITSVIPVPFCLAISGLLTFYYGVVGAASSLSITYFSLALFSAFAYSKYTSSSLAEMFVANGDDLSELRSRLSGF